MYIHYSLHIFPILSLLCNMCTSNVIYEKCSQILLQVATQITTLSKGCSHLRITYGVQYRLQLRSFLCIIEDGKSF